MEHLWFYYGPNYMRKGFPVPPTVLSSSFHVQDRISTNEGKQYSTNTDFMRQNGTVRQMNDILL